MKTYLSFLLVFGCFRSVISCFLRPVHCGCFGWNSLRYQLDHGTVRILLYEFCYFLIMLLFSLKRLVRKIKFFWFSLQEDPSLQRVQRLRSQRDYMWGSWRVLRRRFLQRLRFCAGSRCNLLRSLWPLNCVRAVRYGLSKPYKYYANNI